MGPGHLIIVLFFLNEVWLPSAEISRIIPKLDGLFCGEKLPCTNYNFAICFLRKQNVCAGLPVSYKNRLIENGLCMTKWSSFEEISTFDAETLDQRIEFDIFDKKISDVGKMVIFVSGYGNSDVIKTCETKRLQSNNTMTTVLESFDSGPDFRITIQLEAVCKEDNCHDMCEKCDPITTTPETTSVDTTSVDQVSTSSIANITVDKVEKDTTTEQYQKSESSTELINTQKKIFSVTFPGENNSWSPNSQTERSYGTTTEEPVSTSDYHSTPETSVNHNFMNNRYAYAATQSVSETTDFISASTTTVTEDPIVTSSNGTAYSHISNSTKLSTIDNRDNTGKTNLEIYATTEKDLTSDVLIESTSTGIIVTNDTPTDTVGIVSSTSEGNISGSKRTIESEVTTEHNTIHQTGSSFTPTRRSDFSRPTTKEITFSENPKYSDKDILTTLLPVSAENQNKSTSSFGQVDSSTKLHISGVKNLTLATTTHQIARSTKNRTVTIESNRFPSSTTPISTLSTSKDTAFTRTNTTPSIRLESNPVRPSKPSVVYTYTNTTNIYPVKPKVNRVRHSDVIVIAGAAVGGIFLITLLLVFCNLWFKRKNRAKEEIYNTKFYHVY